MIKKTYIPAKPRSPKLVPSTQKSYDRIISSLSEQVNKPQPQIDPRVSELKSYLEVVNTDLARLTETYNTINDSTVIGTMVKTQLTGLKDNVDAHAGAFITYATSALADNVLTEEEIEEIDTRKETYLTAFGAFMAFAEPISISIIQVSILKDDLMKYAREKAQIDSVYPGLYENVYLTGDAKTVYAAAKAAYDTSYSDLVNTIDSYIFDGTVTPAEYDQVQYYAGIYNTRIAEYKQAEETARKAIGDEQKRQAQVYAESLFDDVVETQTALENSLLKYSESINPITAQMMQLIVGDESLQFYFVESKVNPVRVSHSVSYLSGTLTVYAGWIKHLTIGITDISPAHEYKFWNVPLATFGSLDPDKYYYLYAKCSTSAETGEYILSETPVEIDGVSGYYHLLMGILNSENNSTRRFAQLYSFTEILPGRITTDKIVSQDGKTYFDLITALLSIGDGKIVLDGSDGSGQLADGNILWDDAGNVELSGRIASGGSISTIGDGIKLNSDGSGQLAGGNIEWDADGNVATEALIKIPFENGNSGYAGYPTEIKRLRNYIFTDNNDYTVLYLAENSALNGVRVMFINWRTSTKTLRLSTYRFFGQWYSGDTKRFDIPVNGFCEMVGFSIGTSFQGWLITNSGTIL